MEIKEAISFICNLAVNSYKSEVYDIAKEHQKIVEIKKLLQQGEKYRQMWGKLDNGKYVITHFNKAGYLLESITPQEFKQKHFPKK